MVSIVDYLAKQADKREDAEFLTEMDKRLTFGKMFLKVRQMAAFLHEYGVRKGDRVILLIEGKTAHLITYFASMAIGAIPVHLHTQRPRSFVEFAVKNVEAKVMITQNYAEDWENFACPILPFPALNNSTGYWSNERSEIAYMMYTSGTTGLPKAVMTSQSNTLFTANTIIDFAQLTSFERELICLPLPFTFGLGHVHAQLILGGQAHLFASMRDNPAILDILATDKITGFLASPGMLKILVEDYREEFSLKAKALSYLVINCTPMPVKLTKQLLELLPKTRIYMYYGMTEASRSAFNFYNQNPNKLACTGRATKGVSLKIDKANSKDEGEICIKGPNLMLGYWGEKESSCIDQEGWLHTGDLGVMDEDGFITVKGRVKEQISIDGMKCQPLEIESILSQFQSIKDIAVVALANEYTYQTVGAAVVTGSNNDLSKEAKEIFIKELKEYCLGKLELFKIPTKFIFVDSIPRTELGKIKRLEVQQMLMEQ